MVLDHLPLSGLNAGSLDVLTRVPRRTTGPPPSESIKPRSQRSCSRCSLSVGLCVALLFFSGFVSSAAFV